MDAINNYTPETVELTAQSPRPAIGPGTIITALASIAAAVYGYTEGSEATIVTSVVGAVSLLGFRAVQAIALARQFTRAALPFLTEFAGEEKR